MDTEFKAFEFMDDAMKFYNWHKLKGDGVALYDGSLARMEFSADCGYKPSFFDRQIKSIPRAVLTAELSEIDPEAPYFFGFSFNGKPGGRIIIDREEAWNIVEDPYWQETFSLRLYNANRDILAYRGLDFAEERAEHRLDHLADRELIPFKTLATTALKAKEEPVKPKVEAKKVKKAKITKKPVEKKKEEAKSVPKSHVETDKALDAYVTKMENKKKMKTNEKKENKLFDPFAEEVKATIDRLLAGERFLEAPLPVPVPEIVEPVIVAEPVIAEPAVEVIVDPEIRDMHKGPLRRFWKNIKTDPEISSAQD